MLAWNRRLVDLILTCNMVAMSFGAFPKLLAQESSITEDDESEASEPKEIPDAPEPDAPSDAKMGEDESASEGASLIPPSTIDLRGSRHLRRGESPKEASEEKSLPMQLQVFLAAGFPHIAAAGFDFYFWRGLGLGLSYGQFPIRQSGIKVGIKNMELRLRFLPWGYDQIGFGVLFGKQEIEAEAEREIEVAALAEKYKTTLTYKVESNYVTPHIMLNNFISENWAVGFELGYQFNLNSSSTFRVKYENLSDAEIEAIEETDLYKDAKSTAEKRGKQFGEDPIVYVIPLRISYVF